MSEPISTLAVSRRPLFRTLTPVDQAETLALVFEDDQAALRLTLYYTAYEDRATITSFSKIENCSDETVVIHKALSVMADVPAGDYDVITLQRRLCERKNSPPSASRAKESSPSAPTVVLLDMPRPQLLSLLTMK